MRKFTLLALGLLALSKAAPIIAKPSSSAGILEKQVQREYEVQTLSPNKKVPLLEIDIPEKRFDIPEGASAYIKNIILEDNTILSKKEVSKTLAPYLDRELSGKDVTELSLTFDALYAKKGYILAWTYPPVQVIENDTLILKVLEGHLESVEISGNTSYSTRFIERYFASLLTKSLNYNDLIQAVLLLMENKDLDVKSVLRKGNAKGGVILYVKVHDKRPYGFSAGYNNWGTKVTTYNQIATQGHVGNLIASGDNLTMMTSFGVPPTFYYLNPVYTIPLTGSGTTLSLSYLFSYSNLQEYKELKLTGWSEIGSIGIQQPLIRTRQFDMDVFCSFDIKQIKNLQAKNASSFDKLRVFNTGLSFNYIDTVQGRTFCDTQFHIGIPNILGGSPAILKVPIRNGAGARYYIMNINLQRLQTLPQDFSLNLIADGQGTFNKLPFPEQFYLGGIGTVRGYPSAAAVGDIGYHATCELYAPPPFFKNKIVKVMKKPWKDVLKFLAFVDHGGIYTNEAVYLEESPAYLTAAGIGLRFYGPSSLDISFDTAFPLTKQYKTKSPFFYVRVNMSLF
jgi:hemolysin activation/secretion protein